MIAAGERGGTAAIQRRGDVADKLAGKPHIAGRSVREIAVVEVFVREVAVSQIPVREVPVGDIGRP